MDETTRELLLANRQFVWGLIARGFAEEADEAFVAVLAGELAREEVGLVEDEESEAVLAAFDELAAFFDGAGDRLAAARDQYTRVFVGPGTLLASPYETMHTTGKRQLFHRDVLPIREAYRRAGFAPARLHAIPDDAIGLECDFMAKLAAKAAAAAAEGDEVVCRERLLQSLTFLTDHLGRWIDSLAESIAESYGPDNVYAALARFTALWCRRDRRLLDALLEGGECAAG